MIETFYQGTGCTYAGPWPQCPKCGGGTMKVDEQEFKAKHEAFERGEYKWDDNNSKEPAPAGWMPRPHPGFMKMLEWAALQPHCYKHIFHLRNAYRKYVGIEVEMAL